MQRTALTWLFALMLSATAAGCGYMGSGSSGARQPKQGFKPPAGAFHVRRFTARSGQAASEEGTAEGTARDRPALGPAAVVAGQGPTSGGLPAALLAPGSAREADVRAERLYRLLLEGGALSKSVRVRIAEVTGEGLLRVSLEMEGPGEPSLAILSALAEAALAAARQAVPEAEPAAYLELELTAQGRPRATWRGGGWHFPPTAGGGPPPAPRKIPN